MVLKVCGYDGCCLMLMLLCMKKSRFFFKNLRIVLILHRFSQEKAGSIVVERSNSLGV